MTSEGKPRSHMSEVRVDQVESDGMARKALHRQKGEKWSEGLFP